MMTPKRSPKYDSPFMNIFEILKMDDGSRKGKIWEGVISVAN